jgi:TetR/AcrR family transcriptional regulator
MKKAFENLSSNKKQRVLDACIDEFGENGYEGSSTEGIIRRAGISKGGLYEYTTSKKDIFFFIIEYTYGQLYDYLRRRIKEDVKDLPDDLLQRLRLVSELAIDFYIGHPRFVYLIARTYHFTDDVMDKRVQDIFKENFLDIFGDIDDSGLKFDRLHILDLAMWLLLKTRYDFLLEIKNEKDPVKIKIDYVKNWDFYLSIMKNGIYKNADD